MSPEEQQKLKGRCGWGCVIVFALAAIVGFCFLLADLAPKIDQEDLYEMYKITGWTKPGEDVKLSCGGTPSDDPVDGAYFECNAGEQRVTFSKSSTLSSVCSGPQRFEVKLEDQQCDALFDINGKKKDDDLRARAPYDKNFEDYTDEMAIIGVSGSVLGIVVSLFGCSYGAYRCSKI
jgi:hypothetical protein